MKSTLYDKQGHAYTVAYKNFLNPTAVPYIYKDVSKGTQAREHSKKLYGVVVKFPTLFVDEVIYLTPTTDALNKVMQDLKLRA